MRQFDNLCIKHQCSYKVLRYGLNPLKISLSSLEIEIVEIPKIVQCYNFKIDVMMQC